MYDPLLTHEAEADFDRLSAELQEEVTLHLYRLADHPASLSRPSMTPPEPKRCQAYDFSVLRSGLRHVFTLFFRYDSDEQTLIVLAIWHEQRNT